MIHVISLGAGVQSSTMALMAAHGEIEPMPECAIFADTQWEPASVYAWLDHLEKRLPFPVYRVSQGNLREEQVTSRQRGKKDEMGGRWASLPYFTKADGQMTRGMVRRQCTFEYKIRPIERCIKLNVLGLKPRARMPKEPILSQWRGISADEAHRMKPSHHPWMIVRYPLAMEHGMTRADCLAWMERNGYQRPPRSACIGCPFHNDHEWLQMRDERPDEWADAVDFDRSVRKARGMRGDTFLHSDCVPLDQVQFKRDRQTDFFGNECEGMCGV